MKRRQSSDTKNRAALIDPRHIVNGRRAVVNAIFAGLISLGTKLVTHLEVDVAFRESGTGDTQRVGRNIIESSRFKRHGWLRGEEIGTNLLFVFYPW